MEAVKEVKELGQKLTVRSKGHSSNDLVLSDHGAVLLMQAMDNIVEVDEAGLTATVQGGAISALVDDHLAPMGLGLPVIGDHKDITVGGFASVGGISPGSHRFGMFIDNVLAIEFVDWDGNVKWCSKEENSEDYYTPAGRPRQARRDDPAEAAASSRSTSTRRSGSTTRRTTGRWTTSSPGRSRSSRSPATR